MRWPATPLELSSSRRFRPPHCPWPACPSHRPSRTRPFLFHCHGSFLRRNDKRRVPRFLCLRCRRTFSLQTFAFSYYLKRPDLSFPIAAGLNAGSAHRQLARSLRASPTTVTRFSSRLGRHCILLLSRALARIRRLEESIVYDDFISFVSAQECPLGMATAVGSRSWFIYYLEQAPHRRGGKRRPGSPPPPRYFAEPPRGAFRSAAHRTLTLLKHWGSPSHPIRFLTDNHPAYAAALKTHPARESFHHRVYPNPKRAPKGSPRSPLARRRDRAMFPVDLLHKIIRHTHAHHRRETIAFGRRLEAALERGFALAVWRNFVKARSERRPREGTPAMRLGLATEAWSWERVLSRRLFRSRERVPKGWVPIYERRIGWPDPARMRPLELKYAV